MDIQHVFMYAGHNFYGVENIPYLFRARAIGINVSGTSGLMLLLPEVWNPCDPNSGGTGTTPTAFRFLLSGTNFAPSVAVTGNTRVYVSGTQGTSAVSQPGATVSLDADATELDFTIPAGSSAASEPVFLGNIKNSTQATAISLTAGGNNGVRKTGYSDSSGYVKDTISGQSYCGVLLGQFPTTWVTSGTTYPLLVPPNDPLNPSSADGCGIVSTIMADYILQYKDASGSWTTYQDNYSTIPSYGAVGTSKTSGKASGHGYIDISGSTGNQDTGTWIAWMDPRTSRFGACWGPSARLSGPQSMSENYYGKSLRPGTAYGEGFGRGEPGTGLQTASTTSPNASKIGWYPGNWSIVTTDGSQLFVPAYYAENVTGIRPSPQGNANYFTDPDGVVRRGMAAYVAANPSSTVGMPLASLSTSTTQSQSRPFILNRPFRSVAELGYVFSGTPWRNIDFLTPESGCSALLDLFCINDPSDLDGMVAGKINLNTRQLPVLKAILAGINTQGDAYKDELHAGGTGATDSLSSAEITQIAQALINRTTNTNTSGQGPLCNISELVGKWNSAVTISGALAPNNIDGSQSYTGFSSDLSSIFDSTDPSYSTSRIQRLRESAIRALSSSGQTRVWNLMIDVVAQTGRYRSGETSLDKFVVDGERRYWLHVAIDRFTGKIIDKQIELVKE